MLKKISIDRLFALLKLVNYLLFSKIKFHGLIYIGKRVELKLKNRGKILIRKKTFLKKDIELYSEGTLDIGRNVFVNNFSYIVCLDKIVIEDNVMIGERVSIRDHDHKFDDVNIETYKQKYVTAPILIKKDSWIGCNSVILKGVTIGCHSVVAANSVVNKDVPDYSVVGGTPAKIIKKWDANLSKWISYREENK